MRSGTKSSFAKEQMETACNLGWKWEKLHAQQKGGDVDQLPSDNGQVEKGIPKLNSFKVELFWL